MLPIQFTSLSINQNQMLYSIYEKIVCYTSFNSPLRKEKSYSHSLKHQVEFCILYFYIMSHAILLSPERDDFVFKIFNEMYNNANVNNSDEESRKGYFFSLVKKNKELSENEKEYCKER